MDEQNSTPYVDWEYYVIADNRALDGDPRMQTVKKESLLPGGGWHIEFQGQTRGGELLLANYHPPDDLDAREWLNEFGSKSLPSVPVSIDTYFGPQSEREYMEDEPGNPDGDLTDAEHTIYIGHGWAKQYKTEVIITIPPEVFRDAALSLISDFKSHHADIEQRIFRVFEEIDPDSYERFLSTVENIGDFPQLDAQLAPRHRRKATFAQHELTYPQMMTLLKQDNGIITYRQLYTYIDVQGRTVRRWLCKAGVVDETRQSLRDAKFTSDEIRNKLLPWLLQNQDCPEATEFVSDLLRAHVFTR